MLMSLTVGIIVLGVVAIVGAVGYLVDKSGIRRERNGEH